MRTTLILLLFTVVALAADPPQSLQPAKIISVTTDKDTTALVIRYEISGTAHEQRILLPASVSDFRYCRWGGFSGIAIVARTGGGWTSQYFYSAFHLTGQSSPHRPVSIPGPAGDFEVLGIGNNSGESLIITAFRQHPELGERVSGWLYIDQNPLTDRELPATARGHLRTFELPTEPPEPSK